MIRKILFLLGLLLCLYPALCHVYEKERQWDAVVSYRQTIENLEENQVEKMIQAAEEYNRKLCDENSTVGTEFQDYQDILNPAKNGVMGCVTIPKINVCLPIYHGTGEQELENGLGHVEGSSLPVGGANTHSLLAGHRGLPESELLLRLGELAEGDTFELQVCDRKIRYRVCEIRVIKPDDVESLAIQKERDMVSLITCTPYGINTHRLVVTGEREENI